MERHFNPPYNDSGEDRHVLHRIRMRTILDAGDYAIETNRHHLITFLHEFLRADEKAYEDGAETSNTTTKDKEQ